MIKCTSLCVFGATSGVDSLLSAFYPHTFSLVDTFTSSQVVVLLFGTLMVVQMMGFCFVIALRRRALQRRVAQEYTGISLQRGSAYTVHLVPSLTIIPYRQSDVDTFLVRKLQYECRNIIRSCSCAHSVSLCLNHSDDFEPAPQSQMDGPCTMKTTKKTVLVWKITQSSQALMRQQQTGR